MIRNFSVLYFFHPSPTFLLNYYVLKMTYTGKHEKKTQFSFIHENPSKSCILIENLCVNKKFPFCVILKKCVGF